LLLCEDTYHSPIATLAREILGVPLSAQIISEGVKRGLLLDARQLRAKVWASSDRCKNQGADLIRVDGFVDSEESPKVLEKALQVERQLAESESNTKPLPCSVHLHVLKPNQEGLLQTAPEPLLRASETAVERLGGEGTLGAGLRAALHDARNRLSTPGKRPVTKAGVMRVFDGLFAGRRKSFYMPIIGAVPELKRAAFQPEPTCMRSLP